MKQILFSAILIVTTAIVTSITCLSLCGRNDSPEIAYSNIHPLYTDLVRANTPEQMEKALADLEACEKYIGAVPRGVSRNAFLFTIELRDRVFQATAESRGSDQHGREYARYENWTGFVSHLAAISGDVELLRMMVTTYFGSATGECKGWWIEEFLQYNPDLFFSLPDTLELWNHAGGAPWCCNEPEVTIPIVRDFASSTRDAQRILDDITADIHDYDEDTPWVKEARKLLSESR